MGYLQASEMRKFVGEKVALRWHLTGNHYPPLPASMIEPCEKALALARAGEWEHQIELPNGVSYHGSRTASVRAIIEGHHLDAFLEDDQED